MITITHFTCPRCDRSTPVECDDYYTVIARNMDCDCGLEFEGCGYATLQLTPRIRIHFSMTEDAYTEIQIENEQHYLDRIKEEADMAVLLNRTYANSSFNFSFAASIPLESSPYTTHTIKGLYFRLTEEQIPNIILLVDK